MSGYYPAKSAPWANASPKSAAWGNSHSSKSAPWSSSSDNNGWGKGSSKGAQKGGYGSSLPFKAPPSTSAPSSASMDFGGPDDWGTGEPDAKRMRGEDDWGNPPAPWKMGGPPPPKSGWGGGQSWSAPEGPGVTSKGGGMMDAPQSLEAKSGWSSSYSPNSSTQSLMFKGGPPSKGPPGPPPGGPPLDAQPKMPGFGGGGFLFGGAGLDTNVQLQNETERLRQERIQMEEERARLEQLMEERKKAEEERKKAQEEAEKLRIEQEEARKIEEEKRRQEEEKRKAELEEIAKGVQAECEELVTTAEDLMKQMIEKSAEMEKGTVDDEVLLLGDEIEIEVGDIRSAIKLCGDFMNLKHSELIGASEESRQKTQKFRDRTQLASRNVEREILKVANRKRKAIASKEAEARRVAAVKAAEKQENMFKQYDADGDSKLNAVEIMEFVKGEYDFEFPLEKAQAILKQDAFLGVGGVSYAKFPHLKMLIGIARNEAMARKRKLEKDAKDAADAIENERKRKLAVEQTAQVLEGVKIVDTAMAGIEAEVVKAEEKAKPLAVVRGRGALMGDAVHDRADEVETAVEAARDFLAAAKDQASSMAGVPNDKLEPSVIPGCPPARQLFFRLEYMEKRLGAAAKAAEAARNRVILAQKKAELLKEASAQQHAMAVQRHKETMAAQQAAAELAAAQPPQPVQPMAAWERQAPSFLPGNLSASNTLPSNFQPSNLPPSNLPPSNMPATDMSMLGMQSSGMSMPGIPIQNMPPMQSMPAQGMPFPGMLTPGMPLPSLTSPASPAIPVSAEPVAPAASPAAVVAEAPAPVVAAAGEGPPS